MADGMTLSVDVVELPPDPYAELTAALAAADRALYQAKRRGGNCVAIGTLTERSIDGYAALLLQETAAAVARSLRRYRLRGGSGVLRRLSSRSAKSPCRLVPTGARVGAPAPGGQHDLRVPVHHDPAETRTRETYFGVKSVGWRHTWTTLPKTVKHVVGDVPES